MNENDEMKQAWSKVEQLGKDVQSAYAAFLDASDMLAQGLMFKRDYVLGKLMPNKMTHEQRRDVSRVDAFLKSEKDCFRRFWDKEQQELKREALLERLALSQAEKRLLGIADQEP
jgi:hypothetical protein